MRALFAQTQLRAACLMCGCFLLSQNLTLFSFYHKKLTTGTKRSTGPVNREEGYKSERGQRKLKRGRDETHQ
jgi:hypothetical protein